MAVVVNDRAIIAKVLAFEANARFAKWTKADALVEDTGIIDLQNATALGDDCRCCSRINGEIVADFIRAAEKAIIPARDRVHERLIVANDRAI